MDPALWVPPPGELVIRIVICKVAFFMSVEFGWI